MTDLINMKNKGIVDMNRSGNIKEKDIDEL